MHTVAVLALDKVIPFDLATPIEVFTRTRLSDGEPGYRVLTCAAAPTVDAGSFTLRPPHGLDALAEADTIVLPGCADPTAPVPDEVLDALRRAAAAGTRIASICSGAFVLAADTAARRGGGQDRAAPAGHPQRGHLRFPAGRGPPRPGVRAAIPERGQGRAVGSPGHGRRADRRPGQRHGVARRRDRRLARPIDQPPRVRCRAGRSRAGRRPAGERRAPAAGDRGGLRRRHPGQPGHPTGRVRQHRRRAQHPRHGEPVRRGRGRCRAAAAARRPGHDGVVVLDPVVLGRDDLAAGRRTRREGVRVRRDARPQRRVRRADRGGRLGGRAGSVRPGTELLRRGRAGHAAGGVGGRAGRAVRGAGHQHQEVRRRIAGPGGGPGHRGPRGEHGVTAADVAAIEILLPANAAHVVDDRRMPDVCVQYLVAGTLLDGGFTFAMAHDEARMTAPDVRALRAVTTLTPDESTAGTRAGTVVLRTHDNRMLRAHVADVRGTAQNPMTESEVRAKSTDLLLPVLGEHRTQELVDRVLDVGGIDAAALAELTRA